jgi:uncharacterized protein (DUF433 family)
MLAALSEAFGMSTPIKTEHPHIVRVPGIAGGDPVIAGSRISVAFIARFLRSGVGAEEIIATYPHLAPAAVYDAISYYLDHRDEIDRDIDENTPEALAKRLGFTVDEHGLIVFHPR